MNEKKCYLMKIANVENFYNAKQRILRVETGTPDSMKYFDFYNLDEIRFPNPKTTLALVETYQEVLDSTNCITEDDERINFVPGYINATDLNLTMPYGFILKLIPTKVSEEKNTIDGSSVGFVMRKVNDPASSQNIELCLHATGTETYTKSEDLKTNPQGDASTFGLTIGNNFVHMKGPDGAAITIGPDGKIAIDGMVYYSKSKSYKAMTMDNPLDGWVPATMVTVPLAIPQLPNIDAIGGFAVMAQRLTTGFEFATGLNKAYQTYQQAQAAVGAI